MSFKVAFDINPALSAISILSFASIVLLKMKPATITIDRQLLFTASSLRLSCAECIDST